MNAAQNLLASNRALTAFLLKMGAIYAAWFVLYDLWLLPDGRLDTWLSLFVADATGAVMRPFYDTTVVDGRIIWAKPGIGIMIENGCNGLSALSLFVGFVVAYPGSWLRRAVFIPVGLAVVVLTNILRCAFLLVVQDKWPSIFGQVHGMHALFVFYLAIFVLWMVWAHWGEPRAARPASAPRAEAVPAGA
jgi:exosortase/archaeosortase family protein